MGRSGAAMARSMPAEEMVQTFMKELELASG